MKTQLICSAPTKEGLQEMINKYYYSENCIIKEDGVVFNTKLNKPIDNHKVEYKRKRWRYISIIE